MFLCRERMANPRTSHWYKPEVAAMFRVHGPSAITELVRLLHDSPDEKVRVDCAKEILNRAYGKAIQPTEQLGDGTTTHRPLIVMIRTSHDAPVPRVTIDAA